MQSLCKGLCLSALQGSSQQKGNSVCLAAWHSLGTTGPEHLANLPRLLAEIAAVHANPYRAVSQLVQRQRHGTEVWDATPANSKEEDGSGWKKGLGTLLSATWSGRDGPSRLCLGQGQEAIRSSTSRSRQGQRREQERGTPRGSQYQKLCNIIRAVLSPACGNGGQHTTQKRQNTRAGS